MKFQSVQTIYILTLMYFMSGILMGQLSFLYLREDLICPVHSSYEFEFNDNGDEEESKKNNHM